MLEVLNNILLAVNKLMVCGDDCDRIVAIKQELSRVINAVTEAERQAKESDGEDKQC